ncbi:(4Fe-4S)-binding protein [Sulfitobacter sp. JL08]|uniref:4Fe-4S binding protein n=1 Tax=Sulfitobacter sp. JL08 TaxID=2070369 RepID=UPI000E0B4465|nr:4Fe-4S binding protein [Sulfitobacter sp. JL08]AXI57127.1 (4Fe-4S)-binding protein [Sulfitobacter sp. JL08]
MPKHLIICDCLGSQSIDADGLSNATGLSCSRLHTALCTTQIDLAAKAIESGDAIIACQQERSRFEELAHDLEADIPGFVDLRDRAGWSADTADKLPKMAALAAEALLPVAEGKSLDVVSEGICLIIGPGAVALEAARKLKDILSLTVLLTDETAPERETGFDIVRGRIEMARGALGGFDLTFDALQEIEPGGRGAAVFSPPKSGASSQCDVIIDLSGNPPLFPAPEKREGYLRADPSYSPAVADVILQASQMVGTFEKPLYVRLEPSLCAHSRAEKPACSNCLNACPTGAITSAGEHVAIDPMICAGCGACSALCPSGAISYDAPTVDTVFRRVQVLASTYRKEAGSVPRLLVHDDGHGDQMISLSARHGRGLPADVIPLEVTALAGFGHAEMLAALGSGFSSVSVLLSPRSDRETLARETELANAIAGTKVSLLDVSDPDALSDSLFDAGPADIAHDPILPMGTRRQVARTAAKALAPDATIVPLPETAPYGAVLVDTDACTLCLSCVSLCPSGALAENPDKPQLRFQEDACLQCGLCSNICPEQAITLEPRFNLTDAAFTQVILNEEEPFACIECGSLFGVKSTVERITEKLAGKHAMFSNPKAARMIQMCDNCRIQAQYHSDDNPFAAGERPKVRTSDDYFLKRKDH